MRTLFKAHRQNRYSVHSGRMNVRYIKPLLSFVAVKCPKSVRQQYVYILSYMFGIDTPTFYNDLRTSMNQFF